MLRWMCGKTRKDRIRNTNIRDMIVVAPIEDKLREDRFRWFGHICRMPTDEVVRRSHMTIDSDNTRGRGRPKLTFDA